MSMFFTIMCDICRWSVPFFTFALSLLPQRLTSLLVSYFFDDGSVHADALLAISKIIQPSAARNITSMGHEEMQTVADADVTLLRRHFRKLWFYYGTRDAWCPLQYCSDMRARLPEADITVCERNIEHAFCLRSSREMAEIVAAKLRSVGVVSDST